MAPHSPRRCDALIRPALGTTEKCRIVSVGRRANPTRIDGVRSYRSGRWPYRRRRARRTPAFPPGGRGVAPLRTPSTGASSAWPPYTWRLSGLPSTPERSACQGTVNLLNRRKATAAGSGFSSLGPCSKGWCPWCSVGLSRSWAGSCLDGDGPRDPRPGLRRIGRLSASTRSHRRLRGPVKTCRSFWITPRRPVYGRST